MFRLAKLSVVGDRLTVTPTPVPDKLTDCGLFAALSVKFSEALRLPLEEGLNVTLTEQVALEATVTPVQESALLAKSAAFVPPIFTLEMLSPEFSLLVSVTLCALLLVPIDCDKNARPKGEKVTDPGMKLATRFATLTVPMPVAKSHPVVALNAD